VDAWRRDRYSPVTAILRRGHGAWIDVASQPSSTNRYQRSAAGHSTATVVAAVASINYSDYFNRRAARGSNCCNCAAICFTSCRSSVCTEKDSFRSCREAACSVSRLCHFLKGRCREWHLPTSRPVVIWGLRAVTPHV
jgi:hypothetical protein